MFINAKRFAAVLSLLSVLCATAVADDWPQFLGPQRNGISTETGLIDSFPASGPKELWRVPGGVGMSGIAVVGDTVVTLVQDDNEQFVLALNAQTGKTHWKSPIAAAYRNPMGDGPRAAPCISGGKVFVYSGEGVLAALNLQNGRLLWKRHPVVEFGGKPAEYGMACSPLMVDEGLVAVTIGAPEAAVAAFNAETGETVWQLSQPGDTAGYSSPAVVQVEQEEQLVVHGGKAALGIQPRSGKLLWRYPYETDYDCNIATPLGDGKHVFLSSGENHGSVLLDVAGTGKPKVVWKSHDVQSVMRNEWQTSILHKGYLYGFDNVGSAGPVTNLACVNALTGEQVWLERRFGKGNLIAADGKLWMTTMMGELVLVKISPEGFQELSRAEVMQTTRQAPALSNKRLFVRDNAEIICFDVAK
ncbi:MAG: PQQ-like beta-propeller repeat protein [Planctomycetaceae bacterium]|nr:PQQ-like beta-propeller repeat protein [Planctomycetaceae bacterium]MCB9953181.1 PQQ-like beta-propeller repeat protein [Planctomycetaceae bacterium]